MFSTAACASQGLGASHRCSFHLGLGLRWSLAHLEVDPGHRRCSRVPVGRVGSREEAEAGHG